MAERLPYNPEQRENNQEALDQARHERSVELNREREQSAERAGEQNQEKAKQEALEAAAKAEKKAAPEKVPLEKRRDTPAQRRAKQKASFNVTMKDAQSHMSPTARTFSKVIHVKGVEKTSEVVGSTVARPNAILAGSVSAFLFSLIVYLVAKYYGYPLSGTETIAAFVLGWLAGLLFDYLRIMITGKKN